VRGTIRLPGSKSLSNRHLAIAAIAAGTSTLEGVLACDDCDRLVAALRAFGLAVESSGDTCTITGGGRRLPHGAAVDLGDGGTPTRFTLALATLAAGPSTVDGSARMRERPIAEGISILRALGATIGYAEAEGRLPVSIAGGGLAGGEVEVGRTVTSQAISAALLVGAATRGGVAIRFRAEATSRTYLDLTVDALRAWGIRVEVEGDPPRRIAVAPGPVAARTMSIEPDASSAAYPAAAALLAGGRVEFPGLPLDSRQPDQRFLRSLAARGARIGGDASRTIVEAPGGRVRAVAEDLSDCPDAAVMAMVLAAAGDGASSFTGLATLRVKESDRIESVAAGLRALGGAVETGPDRVTIHPLPATALEASRAVSIDPRNDHRVAMAFAVLGLVRPGIVVGDPGCVAKSWPGFWACLADLERSRPVGGDLPGTGPGGENPLR